MTVIMKIKIAGFLLLDSPLEHSFGLSFTSCFVKPTRNPLDGHSCQTIGSFPLSVALLCSLWFSSLAASLPDRKTLSRLEPYPLELPDLPLTSLAAVSLERLVSLPPFSVCLLKQPRRSLKKRNSFQRNQRVLTGIPRKVKPSKANCLYLQVM